MGGLSKMKTEDLILILIDLGYEKKEAEEIVKKGIEKKKQKSFYTIQVNYKRGLGDEFLNLKPITAKNLIEAKEIAQKMVEEHFKKNKGEIKEIKVKPNYH